MIDHQTKQAVLKQFTQTLPPIPPEDGILLVDKPSGPTSHDIIDSIRHHFGFRIGKGAPKVGHAGTLDPLASGLLIILIGPMTKKAKEFEGLDKSYVVEATLGKSTDTYDAEGICINEASTDDLTAVTQTDVENIAASFKGPQLQKVPPYSAVKLNGKALYKYAREGNPIPYDQLPEKQITIYDIDFLGYNPPDDDSAYPTAIFHVSCSKGTYIRSLVHDLGNHLEVGAHVSRLRRTAVGSYNLK